MIKQAIIPLAGLGTRLLPLTSVFAKELLPINGKPGIEYILDQFIEAGIQEVIFIVPKKTQRIKNYFYNDVFYKNIITKNKSHKIIKQYKKSKIRTSLFINPSLKDIRLTKKLNVDCIEIHTGKLANLVKLKQNYSNEFNRIKKSVKLASSLKIEVHAGHGLDYKTTKMLTKIRDIEEYNIGHFIIGESIFFGLSKVIKNFKKIIKK